MHLKRQKEQEEPPVCNSNNNKYKCYKGIKESKTLAGKPQVKKTHKKLTVS